MSHCDIMPDSNWRKTHQYVERFTFVEAFDPRSPSEHGLRRIKSDGDLPNSLQVDASSFCDGFAALPGGMHLELVRRTKGLVSQRVLPVEDESRARAGGVIESLLHRLREVSTSGVALSSDLASSLSSSCTLLTILDEIPMKSHEPYFVSRVLWFLAKLESDQPEVAQIVHQLAAGGPFVNEFSARELSGSLWSLARLVRAYSGDRVVHSFIGALTRESLKRVGDFTGQCLSNSLWAMVHLGGASGGMGRNLCHEFTIGCASELSCRDVADFSTQSLANLLWALAKNLGHARCSVAKHACITIIREASTRFAQCQPQELSMLAWATATMYGRHTKVAGNGVEHELFLQALAQEARRRLGDFSPQGISNVAWALATVGVQGHKMPRSFLVEVATDALSRVDTFPPQAVSNLCWSLASLLHGTRGARNRTHQTVLRAFLISASREATLREDEFGWHDMSGIIVALAQGDCLSSETLNFATLLVTRMPADCQQLSLRVMLNIARSAVKLGVTCPVLQPMVTAIGACIRRDGAELNRIDSFQWAEVRRHCPPLPIVDALF